MTRNIGNYDRAARIAVAAAALVVGGVLGFGSAAGIVLVVVAAIMLATGAAGFCPLYLPIHLSTCRRHPARS
jgi:hypothetical protein